VIEDRNIKPGTTLVARYKGKDCTCTVKSTKDGLRFLLEDGREFKSPSSAASAVMGGSAANGWRWWSVAGDAKPKAERSSATKATKAEMVIRPMKGAEGRFFCSACQDAFASEESDPACPQGHTNAPAEAEAPKAAKKPTKKAPAKRKAAAKAKA
jgi:hypothetical protein